MRNCVFIGVCAIVFFCVVLYQGAGLLPFFEVESESRLEAVQLASFDNLKGKSIRKGHAQAYVEEILGDNVPGRDNVVLANAAMQRAVIELAAVPFGFDLIPTFHTSDYVLDRADGYLYMNIERYPNDMQGVYDFDRELNRIASARPSMKVAVSLVTEPYMDENNPSRSLTNAPNLLNRGWLENNCIRPIQVGNVFLETSTSDEDFKESWFNTDHHWTFARALKAYNNIASVLDLKKYQWDEEREIVVSDSWHGSAARKSRDLDFVTRIVDQDFDFSGLRFYSYSTAPQRKWKKTAFGFRELLLAGKMGFDELDDLDDLYSQYYGYKDCIIVNKKANNNKVCLMVADSYARSLVRCIASNYATTVFICPANNKMNSSFEKCVKHWNPDDLIVLWHCLKANQLPGMSPNFV